MSEQGANINLLLPCPFCGGKADFNQETNSEWYVACANRNCHITPITPGFYTRFQARLAWNHRPKVSPEYYQPDADEFTGLKVVGGVGDEITQKP